MTRTQPGRILWEYRPPAAHPILYAGVLVFAFVLATGSLEIFARGREATLYLVYAAPLGATVLLMALLKPSAVRIHDNGIAPSRPLLLRWWRPFIAWDEMAAVFPAAYDVTGAFVSPFASSDGKVTQTGLGLELRDGTFHTVRFTPTRFAQNTQRSRGYREAIQVVRDRFAQLQRPLTPPGDHVTPDERERLLAEARKPFLPFFAIVFLFAAAAPVLWVLLRLRVPVEVGLPVALLFPLGTSLRSYAQSRKRTRILHRLSRAHESMHAGAATPPPAQAAALASVPGGAA